MLSLREQQILRLMADGIRTREIAANLGIAAKTVAGHRTNMMKKLQVRNQAELVKYAVFNNLIGLSGAESIRQAGSS